MKVLRSLTTNFDHMVAAIKKFKDLSTYTFDELMGSLQVHETRLNRSEENDDSNAFLIKSNSIRGSGHSGRGLGIDMNSRDNQQHSNQSKKDMECYYCHKKGHMKAYCYKKQRKNAKWNTTIVTSSVMCKLNVTKRKERKDMQALSKRRTIMHSCLWPKPLKKTM
jgi:hypothetical protein